MSLFVGRNGQGKTNLLEAIYLLSHAKSFRGTKPRGLVRWQEALPPSAGEPSSCTVVGRVLSTRGASTVGFQVRTGKATVWVNEKRVERASGFYGQVITVTFTPDDLELVKGLPVLRRQFVDRILVMADPSFVEAIVSYERALKSRNETIRQAKRSGLNSSAVESELSAWDEILIEHGLVIARKRAYFVQQMQSAFSDTYRKLSRTSGEGSGARLSYESKFIFQGEFQGRERLRELFQVSRLRDFAHLSTTFGVHRDDLQILLGGPFGEKLAKVSASQGESRSIVLALKLAAVRFLAKETGEAPILLLDDVESELDPVRKRALYHELAELESQVVITATNVSTELKQELPELEIFSIIDGVLLAQSEGG